MSRHLAVVIGLGEIGRPIYQMLSEAYGRNEVRGKDLFYPDPDSGITRAMDHTFRYMHTCFPQSPDFVQQLRDYIREYSPKCVIIHSTLSPGMTTYLDGEFSSKIESDDPPGDHYPDIFYSPVRGNIKDGMLWSLKKYTKFVAGFGIDGIDITMMLQHLTEAGFKVRYVEDPYALECAKIWDLAWYGLNIAFYQVMERTLNETAVDVTRVFIESTPAESEGKAPRTLLYGGHIGGHCVIQAIEKVLAEWDIPMLRAALDSNIKRSLELTYERPKHHP